MDASTITHDHIRASTVKGTDVFNTDGEHVGHVDDIVLNKRDGRAIYAIMSFGGFLGIGERYHPLPWQGLTYDPERGGYVVNISWDQLEGAPTYRPGEEPDWNDRRYNDALLTHYGFPVI